MRYKMQNLRQPDRDAPTSPLYTTTNPRPGGPYLYEVFDVRSFTQLCVGNDPLVMTRIVDALNREEERRISERPFIKRRGTFQ